MDKNITEFQNHIRLVVKKPIKKIWEKMFLNIVTKVGPDSIVRPVHIIDEFGGSKQISLRNYKMDDDYIYEIPLVRNLEEKEAEEIIKMWVKFYDVGDFIIETSTPYKEDETVADDSDDLITCCEKAKLKHNKWMRNKVKEGYRYGLTYSEKDMTHPMLRPWEQLPAQYRQIDESTIFGGILQEAEPKRMSADEVLLGLKEKDPTTIQFAQSIGMSPAVITQYGELAQQIEQDTPRKIKIAFLNAEEEIIDFIEDKISQVAKGLSKEISRRDLFRGVGNLAHVLSSLDTISKLMKTLPQPEPEKIRVGPDGEKYFYPEGGKFGMRSVPDRYDRAVNIMMTDGEIVIKQGIAVEFGDPIPFSRITKQKRYISIWKDSLEDVEDEFEANLPPADRNTKVIWQDGKPQANWDEFKAEYGIEDEDEEDEYDD